MSSKLTERTSPESAGEEGRSPEQQSRSASLPFPVGAYEEVIRLREEGQHDLADITEYVARLDNEWDGPAEPTSETVRDALRRALEKP